MLEQVLLDLNHKLEGGKDKIFWGYNLQGEVNWRRIVKAVCQDINLWGFKLATSELLPLKQQGYKYLYLQLHSEL